MIRGVDFAFSHPDPAGLYDLGFRFAGRYIGAGTDDKQLHADEIASLNGAGLAIVSLVEGGSQGALGGYLVGVAHGQLAQADVVQLGIPQDRPMYAAIDFDFQDADQGVVGAYLDGLASVIGWGRVGVYGGLRAVQWAHEVKGVRWLFQTYAWSHGAWYPAAQLRQTLNGQEAAGGQVDLCVATVDDYGGWFIGGQPDNPTGDADMTPEQANELHQLYEGMFHGGTSMGQVPPGQPTNSITSHVAYVEGTLAQLAAAPAGGGQVDLVALADKVSALADAVNQLMTRPLVDAVAVAEAIKARPEIAAAIAADVAAQLGTLSGTLSLSGSLSGRVGGS